MYRIWFQERLILSINNTSILFPKILIEIKKLESPEIMLHFLYNLITQSQLHITFDEMDGILQSYKGVPQGSLLLPITDAIYQGDLKKVVDENCSLI